MNLVLVVPVGIKEDQQDLWRSGNVLYPEFSHRELQGTQWAFSSTLVKATQSSIMTNLLSLYASLHAPVQLYIVYFFWAIPQGIIA